MQYKELTNSLRASLENEDQFQTTTYRKKNNKENLSKIINILETNQKNFIAELESKKVIRIQRKLFPKLDLPYSFEVHLTPEGKLELFVFLKNKGGELDIHGGAKHVKDCLRFSDGRWPKWVN